MSNRFNRLWRKGVVYLAMVAMGGWAFGGLVPALAMAAPAPVDLSSVQVVPDASPNPVATSVPYAVYMNYTAAPATGGQIQLTFPNTFSISGESPVEVTYGPIGTNSTGGSGSISGSTLTPNSTSPNTAQLTLGTIPASVTGAVYGFTVMLNNVQNPKIAGSYLGSDFTVQDPADSATSVSSKTAVVVSPGASTQIALSAPSTLSNSILEPDTVTGPFTVTLEDAYGNPTPDQCHAGVVGRL